MLNLSFLYFILHYSNNSCFTQYIFLILTRVSACLSVNLFVCTYFFHSLILLIFFFFRTRCDVWIPSLFYKCHLVHCFQNLWGGKENADFTGFRFKYLWSNIQSFDKETSWSHVIYQWVCPFERSLESLRWPIAIFFRL